MLELTAAQKKRYGLATGATAGVLLATQALPASATTPIDDVSSTVTAIDGIAAAATGVVVVALGVRMAIKMVNRVMVKG